MDNMVLKQVCRVCFVRFREMEINGRLEPVLKVYGDSSGPRYFALYEIREDGHVVEASPVVPELSEAPIG